MKTWSTPGLLHRNHGTQIQIASNVVNTATLLCDTRNIRFIQLDIWWLSKLPPVKWEAKKNKSMCFFFLNNVMWTLP